MERIGVLTKTDAVVLTFRSRSWRGEYGRTITQRIVLILRTTHSVSTHADYVVLVDIQYTTRIISSLLLDTVPSSLSSTTPHGPSLHALLICGLKALLLRPRPSQPGTGAQLAGQARNSARLKARTFGPCADFVDVSQTECGRHSFSARPQVPPHFYA